MDFITDVTYYLGANLFQCSSEACSSCKLMAAAAPSRADLISVNSRIFGPDANANALVGEFFEEDCDYDRVNAPDHIDQPVDVRWVNGQFGFGFLGQGKGRNPVISVESRVIEQLAEQ